VAGPELVSLLKSTNTTANIEWSLVTGADEYDVYLNEKFVERVKARSLSLKELSPGTSYKVRVNARFGEKPTQGTTLSFSTENKIPTGLALTAATTSTIAVEWKGASNFSRYNVYRDGVKIATTPATTFTFTGLNPGTAFKIYVTGIEEEIESAASDTIVLNTLVTTPAAPTVSAITPVGTTVSWTRDSSAKNYIVRIFGAASTTELATNTVIGSATSTTFTGLSPASSYTVTLQIEYPSVTTLQSATTAFTTTRPAPTGVVSSGITTTAAIISWDAVLGADQYDLSRDSGPITSTSSTSISVVSLSPSTTLSPGVSYSIRVRASFLDSSKSRVFSDWTTVTFTTLTDPNARPVISSAPVITFSGPYASVTEVVGVTMLASTGTWSSVPAVSSYTYRWQRSFDGGTTWGTIDNATSSSYTITESDFGYRLRVSVTATNANGSATSNSATSGVVAAIFNVQAPSVSGDLVVGQILTVNPGIWYSKNEISYSYQWLSDGSTISGATSSAFTLTSSEAGLPISVRVTARSTLGSLAVTSAARGNVTAIVNTAVPTISGVARLTQTLTASSGTWLNAGDNTSYAYQWEESTDGGVWSAISGATSSTYSLASTQVGKYVRVAVKATKTGFTSYPVTAYSSATSLIAAPVVITNSVAPTVSGTWSQGSTLSTTSGTWSTSGTFAYQWQSSSDGSSWDPISGATSSSYVLTSSESGKFIRSVVAINSTTGAGTAYSSATRKVGAPFNTGAPAVTGTIRVGSVQTTTNGTWSNTPTSYSYQWETSTDGISWIAVGSATSSTYTPTFAQANQQLRVVVSAVNDVDTATVTSNVVSGFLPPEATAIPTVSGTAQVNETLTISSPGTWPSTSGGYVYAWQKSTDGITWTTISGAASTTYVLVAADQGYLIRAQVSLSSSSGMSVAYSLATTTVIPA
jgi:hypothetical protein